MILMTNGHKRSQNPTLIGKLFDMPAGQRTWLVVLTYSILIQFISCSGTCVLVAQWFPNCGTRDPSVLLHKKNTFCFHLSGSVNKFLHFCVLPLLVSKNVHYSFSQPFYSCHMCVRSGLPNFDRMILGRMSFPGTRCFQGGTP